VEKALKDVGDKASEDEKKSATEAVAAVKSAMAGDDREDIEAKTQALEQASTALLQKMYEQSAAGAGGAGDTGGGHAGHNERSSKRSRTATGRRRNAGCRCRDAARCGMAMWNFQVS
jgi:hypothetical protein